jgi:hypothetical protein
MNDYLAVGFARAHVLQTVSHYKFAEVVYFTVTHELASRSLERLISRRSDTVDCESVKPNNRVRVVTDASLELTVVWTAMRHFSKIGKQFAIFFNRNL